MAEKVTLGGKPLIPSKYLEAADLGNRRVTVVIERIQRNVEIKGPNNKSDKRPVFFLRGKEKGWVLNSTNLNRIAEVYGRDAGQWTGATVVLYVERVESFGSMVPAVRVDVDATREASNGAASSRANGNGRAKPAPDEQQRGERNDTGPETSSELDAMPAMTDEQNEAAGDDVPY